MIQTINSSKVQTKAFNTKNPLKTNEKVGTRPLALEYMPDNYLLAVGQLLGVIRISRNEVPLNQIIDDAVQVVGGQEVDSQFVLHEVQYLLDIHVLVFFDVVHNQCLNVFVFLLDQLLLIHQHLLGLFQVKLCQSHFLRLQEVDVLLLNEVVYQQNHCV